MPVGLHKMPSHRDRQSKGLVHFDQKSLSVVSKTLAALEVPLVCSLFRSQRIDASGDSNELADSAYPSDVLDVDWSRLVIESGHRQGDQGQDWTNCHSH